MTEETKDSTTEIQAAPVTPEAPPQEQSPAENNVKPITKGMSALQRVEVLERQLADVRQFLQEFVQDIGKLETKVNATVGFTAALGRLLREKKGLTEESLNRAALDNRIDAMRKPITDLLAAGQIKPVEVATENSILVFSETDKATGAVTSERSQLTLRDFIQPIREKLIGIRVGGKVEPLPDAGIVFEALEIYELVAPAQAQVEKSAGEAEPAAETPAQ